MRGVGSPRRSADQACEYSWMVMAMIREMARYMKLSMGVSIQQVNNVKLSI